MVKSLLITVLFLISGLVGTAQEYVHNFVQSPFYSYQKLADDQYRFNFQVSILDYFVPAFSNATYLSGDTLYIQLTCDITQEVVFFGTPLIYNQTVAYNQPIPESIHKIVMQIDVYMLADNPPREPILVPNVYSHLIDLNLSTLQNALPKQAVYPNPVLDHFYISENFDFHHAELINTLGQTVTKINRESSDAYRLQNLAEGFYFLVFYDVHNKFMGQLKLMKKN